METLTPEAPSLDLVNLLDSLDEPACAWRPPRSTGPRCGARADWLLILSCGCVGYECDDHRVVTEGELAAIERWVGAYPCPRHKVSATARFEPVR